MQYKMASKHKLCPPSCKVVGIVLAEIKSMNKINPTHKFNTLKTASKWIFQVFTQFMLVLGK